jgi:hypothetical protein
MVKTGGQLSCFANQERLRSGVGPLGGMVDTTDLKSVDLRSCQFESGSGHHSFHKGFSSLSYLLFLSQTYAKIYPILSRLMTI